MKKHIESSMEKILVVVALACHAYYLPVKMNIFNKMILPTP